MQNLPAQYGKIPIDKIIIPAERNGEGRKTPFDEHLAALVQSIQEVGLTQPITVSADGTLVAGYHRLLACKQLGWERIPAALITYPDKRYAKIAEIDENLVRSNFRVLEEAELLAERKKIYLELYPSTANGGLPGKAGGGKVAKTDKLPSFVDDAAAKTGKDPRTIRRRVALADGLTKDVCEVIRSSALANNQDALLQLAKIEDPADQLEVATKAIKNKSNVKQALRELKQVKREDKAREVAATITSNHDLRNQTLEDADLEAEFYDLVITDPPYMVADSDISRNSGTSIVREYGEWDEGEIKEKEINEWARKIVEAMKPGASLYLFMNHHTIDVWLTPLQHEGLKFVNMLIWSKSNPAPQVRQTRWCSSHEAIAYMVKGRSATTFNWLGQTEMLSVLTGPIAAGDRFHPNQKPSWLIDQLFRVSGSSGGNVLDPFAGSGVVGKVGLKYGMVPTLIEPDENYFNQIKVRLGE